jgi:hypothetical protein
MLFMAFLEIFLFFFRLLLISFLLPFSTSISSKYEGRAATNKERSDHRTNE